MTEPQELLRARLDARLAEVFDAVDAADGARAPEILPITAQLRALTLRGGKRLRPMLVMAAVECAAPWEEVAAAVVEVSTAIELLHTYMLVHDDWMDADTVRRGGVAVHVALSTCFGAARGPGAAILAGDFACALAQQIVFAAPIPLPRLRPVLEAFALLQREAGVGQMLDLLGAPGSDALYDLKTGSYTVRGPLALGHALAGGTAAAWACLEAAARPLGIAFQLRDDLMGVFGDPRETGKGVGTDIRANKRTAPILYALEHLEPSERRELEGLLGTSRDDEVARARALLVRSGAEEATEARIEALYRQSLEALDRGALRAQGREMIAALAARMTHRRS